MIPQRFVTEYPERCLQLLRDMEQRARKRDLLGSFTLLVASAAVTIPFARMTERGNPTGRREDNLFFAIERLASQLFVDAPFWEGTKPEFFRYAEISTNQPDRAAGWSNVAGVHPIKSLEERDGKTVLKTTRNALAHGNIMYLDENGDQKPGNRLCYLAFLSERKGTDGRRVVGYRVVIFNEETFLIFLKGWITWLKDFPAETALVFSEAAD